MGKADCSIRSRFWSKVDRGELDECWEWKASRTHLGYGRFGWAAIAGPSSWIGAHRAAWILVNGDVPDGMVVRHKCDNPPCVNPHHLEIGTQIDNIRDMIRRGRQSFDTGNPGSSNPAAILSEEDIPVIRARHEAGDFYRVIAEDYGVCVAAISHICNRRTWSHVA